MNLLQPCNVDIESSPLLAVYQELANINPEWQVDFGFQNGNGWIPGSALVRPHHDPFKELLARIGASLATTDRRAIASAFATRLGWSAGAAIAPYFLQQCVPDIRLPNISLKFSEGTLFQKVSLHEPRGVMLRRHGQTDHPSIEYLEHVGTKSEREGLWDFGRMEAHVTPNPGLAAALRGTLIEQVTPVVDALQVWANFFRRPMWADITHTWAVQFAAVLHYLRQPATGAEIRRET